MNFQYEDGMAVCMRGQRSFKGHVTYVEADEIRVKWDKYEHESWAEASEVMPDTPEAHLQVAELTAKVQAKVDEATVSLEAAFKAWSEAAALQAGHDNAEAYYLNGNKDLDLSLFEGVLERHGWSTSSLYC